MPFSFQRQTNDDVLVQINWRADPNEKWPYVGRVHYDNDNYGDAIKFWIMPPKEDHNAEIPYLIAHSCRHDELQIVSALFQKAIDLKPRGYWIYELSLICYAMHADKDAMKYMLEAGEKRSEEG